MTDHHLEKPNAPWIRWCGITVLCLFTIALLFNTPIRCSFRITGTCPVCDTQQEAPDE